jgi:hypothetical protein
MAEHKAGLHKKISVIFDGVPIPRDNKPSGTSFDTVPEGADIVYTKPEDVSAAPAVPEQSEGSGSEQAEAVSQEQAEVESVPKDSKQKFRHRIRGQIQGRLFAPKPGVNTARQKLMLILVPVLCVIFVLVIINVFRSPPRKTAKRPDAVKASVKTANSGGKINWEIPQPYPENMRDPMQFVQTTSSAGTAGTEGNKLAVKGIVYSTDNPSAVIGTQIVHQGDEVSGVTILKINEDSVEFEADGKKWTQKVQR